MQNFFRTLAPEQFEAKVAIRADGGYTYSYDGILIFAPALIQACRAGYLEPHMESRLADAAAQLRDEGFRSATYLGRGRYAVVLECSKLAGEPAYFPSREMKVFSIRPQPDGTIMIGGSRPDVTAPCQLLGSDAEIDGRLTVTLERGVEVLRHNAQSNISSPDHFEAYRWRIKSPDADPCMIVRPARLQRTIQRLIR